MMEELHQFERNKVWSLVERPDPAKHNIIGTKWIFRNKQDEDGILVRNKARLVAQGCTQIEGIASGKLMLQLLVSNPFVLCFPLQITMVYCYIKWMSKVHFLMVKSKRKCMLCSTRF